MLTPTEAPAPTRTFFWGNIDVSAPGFAMPPRDEMTIGLGPDNTLRYLSWKNLPMWQKTFGEAEGDFPLSGSRRVILPNVIYDYTSTVLDGPLATPDHFLLRYRIVSTDGQCDYVESTEGTRSGSGWSVVYTEQGKLYGVAIDARAQGTLSPNDPSAPAPVAGQPSLWSAPVEVVAPGFAGTPVDHLTVALDSDGQILSLMFDKYVRQIVFTDNSGFLEPPSVTLGSQGTVTFDKVVPPTSTHFVLRYHVLSDNGLNDYTEGVDGTREGNALVIRHFISGKLWGAAIDGHAAGTLVPASQPAPAPTGGAGGTSGTGSGPG